MFRIVIIATVFVLLHSVSSLADHNGYRDCHTNGLDQVVINPDSITITFIRGTIAHYPLTGLLILESTSSAPQGDYSFSNVTKDSLVVNRVVHPILWSAIDSHDFKIFDGSIEKYVQVEFDGAIDLLSIYDEEKLWDEWDKDRTQWLYDVVLDKSLFSSEQWDFIQNNETLFMFDYKRMRTIILIPELNQKNSSQGGD